MNTDNPGLSESLEDLLAKHRLRQERSWQWRDEAHATGLIRIFSPIGVLVAEESFAWARASTVEDRALVSSQRFLAIGRIIDRVHRRFETPVFESAGEA